MTECAQKTFEFQGLGKRNVTADFSGGYLSSDGGGLSSARGGDEAGRGSASGEVFRGLPESSICGTQSGRTAQTADLWVGVGL